MTARTSDHLLRDEEVDDLTRCIRTVRRLYDRAFRARADGRDRVDDRLAAGVAETRGVHADIGRRQCFDLLFLRAHDAFEGRVTRLVRALRHRHERRQRRLHSKIAALGLALYFDAAVAHADAARVGQARDA